MILGIDFGRTRVGTAILDPVVNIPFPHKLILVSGGKKLKRELMDIVAEKSINKIVFGMPLSDLGLESDWCAEIRRFADWLSTSISVDIIFVNEYATSKEADSILQGKGKKKKKASHDMLAAVLILETYISINAVSKTLP